MLFFSHRRHSVAGAIISSLLQDELPHIQTLRWSCTCRESPGGLLGAVSVRGSGNQTLWGQQGCGAAAIPEETVPGWASGMNTKRTRLLGGMSMRDKGEMKSVDQKCLV